MATRSQSFFAPDQGADERALQEEGEHPFHGQRLADHTAGILRKVRPVRSELEFHRNPRDHADGKIKSEYLGPKPDSLIVFLVPSSERTPFPVNDEQRQPHGELRKEIVIDDREPEL